MIDPNRNLIKRNLIANLTGNGWSALLSFGTIPLYIHFLGIESYGLIGISVMLMTVLSILDMGISTTITRETARLSAIPGKDQEMRNLVHTLELLNWLVAVFIGVVILLFARPISMYWLRPGAMTPQSIRHAVILIGVSMVFQWTFSFYSAGFIGLQKQVLLNVILSIMTTVRTIGAVLILWLISPTIQSYFSWQIIINSLQAAILSVFLRNNLPRTGERAVVQPHLLNNIWRFAAGMGSISIISLIMSQTDKIILSNLLSLKMFGYYTLATVVATSFSRLMGALVTAIFPRFAQLAAIKDNEGLKQVYHKGCQLMSVLIIPVAFFLSFFSREIFLVWTQNPEIADNVYLLVFFLSFSTMFNGLGHLPLSLEYAHGRTRQVFYIVFAMTLILIPAIFAATIRFGAIGASVILTTINLLSTLLIVQFVHRDVLPQEKKGWYVYDVGFPFLVSLGAVGTGRLLLLNNKTGFTLILSLAIVAFATFCAVALTVNVTRNWFLTRFTDLTKKLFHAA